MTEQEHWEETGRLAAEAAAESTHKPICGEYWDRGLNCPCIPKAEAERILKAIEEAGDIPADWGQYD